MNFKINHVWIATSKNSSLHNVYKLMLKGDERTKILMDLKSESGLETCIRKQKDIEVRNPKSLIEGDPYYVSKKEYDEKGLEELRLTSLFSKIIENREELYKGEVVTFKQKLHAYDDESERPRFYIFEVCKEDEPFLVFSLINSRKIVKKRAFFQWGGVRINKSSAIVEISNGIPLPDDITGIYDYTVEKLYVHKTFDFDKMMHLYEAAKAKAMENMGKFAKGDFKIGKEEYMVEGLNDEEVKSKIMGSSRSVNRLSKFNDSESTGPIATIDDVMKKLTEDERLSINHEKKSILVNGKNYRTFVGVIHDSIVQRLISGEVNII